MKKLISIVCVLVLAVALAVPAFAAATTKDDIIAELEAGVTVGDKTKQIPDKYIKLAKEFLAANTLTDAELATAMADLKDAKAIWIATGKTEFKDIPESVQQQLVDKAAASAKKVGAKLTFDGKTLEIVDKSGSSYKAVSDNELPVKYTGGFDVTSIAISVLVLAGVLGAAVVLTKKFRLSKAA